MANLKFHKIVKENGSLYITSKVSDFADFTVGDCTVVVISGAERKSWREEPKAAVTDRSFIAGGKRKGSSQLLPMKHCPFLTEEIRMCSRYIHGYCMCRQPDPLRMRVKVKPTLTRAGLRRRFGPFDSAKHFTFIPSQDGTQSYT